MKTVFVVTTVMLLFFGKTVSGWMLGWEETPRSYKEGEHVPLQISTLTSTTTLMHMDYSQLPFCKERQQLDTNPNMNNENSHIGQSVIGDKIITNSPYALYMKRDMYCEQVCFINLGRREEWLDGVTLQPNRMVRAIRKNYHHNWIVDHLPSAYRNNHFEDTNTMKEVITSNYTNGFPLGFINAIDNKSYIYNHINIEIMYHPVLPGGNDKNNENIYRIVRFSVEPLSIQHDAEKIIDDYYDDNEKNNNISKKEDNFLPSIVKINKPILSCDRTVSNNNYAKSHSKVHTTYDMVTSRGRYPQPASGSVLFSYDVIWKPSYDVRWSNRWDVYVSSASSSLDGKTYSRMNWISIMKNVFLVILFSAIIITFWIRNIYHYPFFYQTNQQQQYYTNLLAVAYDNNEPSNHNNNRQQKVPSNISFSLSIKNNCHYYLGWKFVYADIFRPPNAYPIVLAVATGAGAQLFITFIGTIILTVSGPFNVFQRGSYVRGAVLLYILTGLIYGYTYGSFYQKFHIQNEQQQQPQQEDNSSGEITLNLPSTMTTIFLSLTFPPIILFISILSFQTVVWANGGSFLTVLAIFQIWILMFCIMVPLIIAGAYTAYCYNQQNQSSLVCNFMNIINIHPSKGIQRDSILLLPPRDIPEQPFYLSMTFTSLLSGLIVFGGCKTQLYFIMQSIFLGRGYVWAIFPYLLINFGLLIIISIELAISFTFLQLNKQNYRWWWNSFCIGGSCGVYFFLYWIYFVNTYNHSGVTIVTLGIYCIIMIVVSVAIVCMMGFITLISTFYFIKTMYSSINKDRRGKDSLLLQVLLDQEEEDEVLNMSSTANNYVELDHRDHLLLS